MYKNSFNMYFLNKTKYFLLSYSLPVLYGVFLIVLQAQPIKAFATKKNQSNCLKVFAKETGSDFLERKYKEHNIQVPERHFVLGSGLSEALDTLGKELSKTWREVFSLSFFKVPGIEPPTSNSIHPGLYRYFEHKETGQTICIQCGRIHGYEEGITARKAVRPVIEPFLAGTKKFTLTNIGGGLRPDVIVGTVIAMTDHVNFTGQSPLQGNIPTDHQGIPLGDHFPHMEEVYSKKTRDKIVKELKSNGVLVEEGTYICVPGPNLETPAEIRMFAKWGLDVVGMSTVWEAIALKHAGAEVTGFSMISNPGSGLKGSEISDTEMLKLVKKNGEDMIRGFLCFCDREMKTQPLL